MVARIGDKPTSFSRNSQITYLMCSRIELLCADLFESSLINKWISHHILGMVAQHPQIPFLKFSGSLSQATCKVHNAWI